MTRPDVKGERVLPDVNRGLYHVAGDPQLAEALMTPKEAASAAAVAAKVRAEILAGAYDKTGRAPSRAELAKREGISLENASVVLRMLAAEGWVTLEQGRGTFLLPRRRYRVTIEVPRGGTLPATGADAALLLSALEKSAWAHPAVGTDLLPEALGDIMRVSMTVTAADAGRAVAIALAGTTQARSAHWTWEGWDLARTSVNARPA